MISPPAKIPLSELLTIRSTSSFPLFKNLDSFPVNSISVNFDPSLTFSNVPLSTNFPNFVMDLFTVVPFTNNSCPSKLDSIELFAEFRFTLAPLKMPFLCPNAFPEIVVVPDFPSISPSLKKLSEFKFNDVDPTKCPSLFIKFGVETEFVLASIVPLFSKRFDVFICEFPADFVVPVFKKFCDLISVELSDFKLPSF